MYKKIHVLVPGGKDDYQSFAAEENLLACLQDAGLHLHAPINFHAFCAASGGAFHNSLKTILNSPSSTSLAEQKSTLILVLLRKRLRVSLKAIQALKKKGYPVAIAWKESGEMQIARQLNSGNVSAWQIFKEVCDLADFIFAVTREQISLFKFVSPSEEKIFYLPTPYPVDIPAWNFAVPLGQREGIFLGTREFDVSERRHMSAVIGAIMVAKKCQTSVTVICSGSGKDFKILRELDKAEETLRIISKPKPYRDYLRIMSQCRVVFQLDSSYVPGQVAGDALLCRMPCVGGCGEIERIAFLPFSSFKNDGEKLLSICSDLLRQADVYHSVVSQSQHIAKAELSFETFRKKLARLR